MFTYDVVGVMSGTSLDGLDMLRVCLGQDVSQQWHYVFKAARTLPYPDRLRDRLSSAVRMSGLELALLDVDYGRFVGSSLRDFVRETGGIPPDFVAVHGHTVFHQPEKGLSLQIGNGAVMAAQSGLTVVNDFRSQDVALGGQGAPLVPIGDALLFPSYDFCLNLGGISNISYRNGSGDRTAFDISVCNMALNRYAARKGAAYDKDGRWARVGRILPGLLQSLDALDYYRKDPPKSLGFEWFEQIFLPVVEAYADCACEDILHTLVEHIARQIACACRKAVIDRMSKRQAGKPSMLLTGGGALNVYLAERIAALSGAEIAPVDTCLVEYKEALIFALLGVLRMQGRPNCLSSVTGAARDNIGGAVYLGK